MANIKICKKRVYLSKTLKEKLSIIRDHACTVIYAPMGYGKTTVLRHYLKTTNHHDYWVNGDSSKELFWRNLCDKIEESNPGLSDKFYDLGFPETEKQISDFVSMLRKLPLTDNAVIIIDDYYVVESAMTNKIIHALVKSDIKTFKLVIISRTLTCNQLIDLALRDEIGCISKDDFNYSPEDIISYFRLNELLINSDTAQQIYRYSGGWPFIIKLQMLNFADSKDVCAEDRIDAFIKNDIWQLVPADEKVFLLKLSIFDEFTLSQACIQTCICPNDVEKILDSNEYINYNINKRTYTINTVYRKYISKMFADISMDLKIDTIKSAGRLFEESNKHFQAICCYNTLNDFDSIYAIKPSLHDMYSFITKEYKELFLGIANSYWVANKNGNYDFSIILSFILFLYNERQIMINLIGYISNDIEADPYLTMFERNRLIAELSYASAYCEFNDFHKMNKHFIKSAGLTNEPLTLIAKQVPISLGSPSIMTLYHNECGMLNFKLNSIDKYAPNYYRLTNGHGQGFETIFRAEVLYNRGEFEGAQALCHKAIYMSESEHQNSVSICALLILSRLAIHDGNAEMFYEYMRNFEQKRKNQDTSNFKLFSMVDVAKSFLYATIDDKDNICEWLKDDKKIEENTNFIMFCYANIIYGKYLILEQQYYHFLGISGQLLALTTVFSYVLPRIYTYIHIAIANNETKEFQKANKFLMEAISMAASDNLYMPFVENFEYIEQLLSDIVSANTYTVFIKEIRRISRTYTKGLKLIQKARRSSSNFGLTAREADVAKLAAQRLSNKEIAETLFIAESTVKSNMKMIFNKLSINSRVGLKEFFD